MLLRPVLRLSCAVLLACALGLGAGSCRPRTASAPQLNALIFPAGWPDADIAPPRDAIIIDKRAESKAIGPGGRPQESYRINFEMPGGEGNWQDMWRELEGVLKRKGWYVMDRQSDESGNYNFYAAPDAQRTVFLFMQRGSAGATYTLEIQVEKEKREVQPGWKKL